MATNYDKLYERDYQNLLEKYDKKSEELKLIKYEYQLLKLQLETKEKQIKEIEEKTESKFATIIESKDKVIEEKEKEIERLKGLLNLDGSNSGLPTSKTPLNKNKIIPNTRKKTGNKIGGQKKHPKHKLEKFKDEEINDIVEYKLEKCPICNGELEEIGEIYKDETSYKFVTIKRRNKFKTYNCKCCHKEVHEQIPNHLKEENQYGAEVKAMALSLSNEGNVAINKIRRLIKGFSHNEIEMSEGFIAKLQKVASDKLEKFKIDLYKKILTLDKIYWDDTVIMINKKRACLRFYGNKKIAYYTAHEQKNENGILIDQILNTLSKNVSVIHDHNIINYKYSYQNIECNIHLIRDLEKCKNNSHHEWCDRLKQIIQNNIHNKNQIIKDYIDNNPTEYVDLSNLSFDLEYINEFDSKYEEIMLQSIEEVFNKPKTHYYNDEIALINRIFEYKDNYFLWHYDFSLPSDNNLSERALRGVKSKMKVSGQFQNIKYAEYYANIKTYIETCYRNNINPTDALIRLMQDNPFTIDEIFPIEKEDESN